MTSAIGLALLYGSVMAGGAYSVLCHAPEPPFVQGAPMAFTSMEKAWVVLVPIGGGSSHGAEQANT